MKKLWLIIIIVAVCVLAGLLLFWFLFRAPATENGDKITEDLVNGELSLSSDTGNEEANPATGVTEISAEDIEAFGLIEDISEEEAAKRLPVLERIIDAAVISPTLASEGKLIQYYDVSAEEMRTTNFVGDNQQTIDYPMQIATEIFWATDKNSYAYETPEKNMFYAGLDGEKEVDLGKLIKSPVFVGANNLLAYHYSDPANSSSTVSVGDPAQSLQDYSVLARIRGNVTVRAIPGTNKVGYYLSPSIKRQAGVYIASLDSSDKEVVTSKAYATDAIWGPGGTHMAYTVLGENGRPQLNVANGTGRNSQSLEFTTYVEKIAFSQIDNKIYMAVPKVLPRIVDFYAESTMTKDRIFEVDLATGEAVELYDLSVAGEEIGAFNLFLSPEEKLLYFTDDTNSNLYVLNLAKLKGEIEE